MYLIDFRGNGKDTITSVGIIFVIIDQIILLSGIKLPRWHNFGYYRCLP